MAARGTKYRYGQLCIDVEKIKDVSSIMREFKCTIRGFGGKKDIPRKVFTIEAETNAKAARLALEKYNRNVE